VGCTRTRTCTARLCSRHWCFCRRRTSPPPPPPPPPPPWPPTMAKKTSTSAAAAAATTTTTFIPSLFLLPLTSPLHPHPTPSATSLSAAAVLSRTCSCASHRASHALISTRMTRAIASPTQAASFSKPPKALREVDGCDIMQAKVARQRYMISFPVTNCIPPSSLM
jgi:hypothetical protein